MPRQKSTTPVISTQLSLFDHLPEDKRPLPELIASGGSDWAAFTLAYVDVENLRYYAVQDWLRGVAFAENPSRYWTDMKKRMDKAGVQTYASCVTLPYRASDGKTYKRDHATAETLYAITQRMDTNTGIRDRILAYLAAAGVRMDEQRIDPSIAIEDGYKGLRRQGMDERKAQARAKGIMARSEFGFVAKVTHENGTPDYAALTAHEYLNLFGRGKAAIVKELNLTDSEARQFRDHLDTLALLALDAAETTAAHKMENLGRLLNDEEQIEIVVFAARLAAPAFKAMAEYAGTDLATGRKLIR